MLRLSTAALPSPPSQLGGPTSGPAAAAFAHADSTSAGYSVLASPIAHLLSFAAFVLLLLLLGQAASHESESGADPTARVTLELYLALAQIIFFLWMYVSPTLSLIFLSTFFHLIFLCLHVKQIWSSTDNPACQLDQLPTALPPPRLRAPPCRRSGQALSSGPRVAAARQRAGDGLRPHPGGRPPVPAASRGPAGPPRPRCGRPLLPLPVPVPRPRLPPAARRPLRKAAAQILRLALRAGFSVFCVALFWLPLLTSAAFGHLDERVSDAVPGVVAGVHLCLSLPLSFFLVASVQLLIPRPLCCVGTSAALRFAMLDSRCPMHLLLG